MVEEKGRGAMYAPSAAEEEEGGSGGGIKDMLIKKAKELAEQGVSLGRQVPAGIIDIAAGAPWAVGDMLEIMTPYLPDEELSFITDAVGGAAKGLKKTGGTVKEFADFVAGDREGATEDYVRSLPRAALQGIIPVPAAGVALGTGINYGLEGIEADEMAAPRDRGEALYGALGDAVLDRYNAQALTDKAKNVGLIKGLEEVIQRGGKPNYGELSYVREYNREQEAKNKKQKAKPKKQSSGEEGSTTELSAFKEYDNVKKPSRAETLKDRREKRRGL